MSSGKNVPARDEASEAGSGPRGSAASHGGMRSWCAQSELDGLKQCSHSLEKRMESQSHTHCAMLRAGRPG